MFFWYDCLVSIASTIWFAVSWYLYTDHSLPEKDVDPSKKEKYERAFLMETYISLFILLLLRIVHIYFAFVVTRYYKNVMSKSNYSRVSTENIDLEDTTMGRDAHPVKPAID
ncbi:hypothetical protein BDB01DRAFT_42932 [Pilobolus umbonatus]|nr:hypothetical protein BDB01DRAFT_42932 [Pilobolus umbonatus]